MKSEGAVGACPDDVGNRRWLHGRLQGCHRHNGNGSEIQRILERDILTLIKHHP